MAGTHQSRTRTIFVTGQLPRFIGACQRVTLQAHNPGFDSMTRLALASYLGWREEVAGLVIDKQPSEFREPDDLPALGIIPDYEAILTSDGGTHQNLLGCR